MEQIHLNDTPQSIEDILAGTLDDDISLFRVL